MSESEKERAGSGSEPDTEVHPGPGGAGSASADESAAGTGGLSATPTAGDDAAKKRASSLSAAPAPQPRLEDVQAWEGYRVDGIDGHAVARVEGLFADAASGQPAWVLVKLGRFGRVVPISIRECAAAAGRVWVPHDREMIRNAPAVDPEQPLTGEQERLVLEYYGIPDTVGRAAEIKDRDPGRVTSRPPA